RALVWSQHLRDSALDERQQLALLSVVIRSLSAAGKDAPRLRLERHFPALPGPLAELDCCLEQRELVGPGREAAGAAKVVQPSKDGEQSVVRRLGCDLVQLLAAQVRQARSPSGDLEARCPQQQRMQAREGSVTNLAIVAELSQPPPRLGIEFSLSA